MTHRDPRTASTPSHGRHQAPDPWTGELAAAPEPALDQIADEIETDRRSERRLVWQALAAVVVVAAVVVLGQLLAR